MPKGVDEESRSRSFGLIGATAEVSDTIRLIRVFRHGRWVRQPVGHYAPVVPVAGAPSPCDTAPGPWDEHGALVPDEGAARNNNTQC